MIDYETLLDSLLVIIGTTTLLTTKNQALHQFLLGHIKFDHRSHLVATFVEHLLQGLSLWDRTGEAVEDHTLMVTEGVIYTGKDADHQVVGDQLTVVDITGCGLTQFRALLNLTTKHVTR